MADPAASRSNRVDPDYLRLYLTLRRVTAALTGAATGSVISNLRRDALKEGDVYLPDLETQKRLAETTRAIESHLTEFEDTLKVLSDLRYTAREGFASGILVASNFGGQGYPQTGRGPEVITGEHPSKIVIDSVSNERISAPLSRSTSGRGTGPTPKRPSAPVTAAACREV